MAEVLDISNFLQQSLTSEVPILDVRAPKEYQHGHIPGAANLPIFEDEERHIVGIQYKQLGREQAVLRGLELVGPKLAQFVTKANQLAPNKKLMIHCWRGGMRSKSMAWLWETSGFDVSVLKGGYKSYRKVVHEDLAQPLHLIVLGGKSGSGKTALLHALKAAGEQIIDLEQLANHKGSAFGSIGLGNQPSVEQFENDLHQIVQSLDPTRRIWVEDESNAIGRIYIPQPFWQQMRKAVVLAIEVEEEERIERLVEEYTGHDDRTIEEALHKLKKRLGGDRLTKALKALKQKDYESTAQIALQYYDKAYLYSLERKRQKYHKVHSLSLSNKNLQHSVKQVIEYCQTHINLHDRVGYNQIDKL